MFNFKSWFCKHEYQEILRYYNNKKTLINGVGIDYKYHLHAHKIKKCEKCGRTITQQVFDKTCVWYDGLKDDIKKLKDNGYIDYEDYLLQ